LKLNLKIILFTFLFIINSQKIFSQRFSLEITSLNETENEILRKIDFKNKHKSIDSLKKEIINITLSLKRKGFFTNTLDSIKVTNKKHIAYYTLNYRIKTAAVKIEKELLLFFEKLNITNNKIHFPIEKLESTLSDISNKLEKRGQSFSKVKIKNIRTIKDTLYADLKITQTKKRAIDKIIIKGYKDFPKSYIKNYYNIKSNSIFSKKKLNQISNLSNSLKFATEIKPPEVLFTKDSTLIYVYLKKEKNNSFDGIVNFATQENGKVLFIGNLDLLINNVFNKGEEFNINWNSLGNESQEFKLRTEIPYIFNSKISPEISFSIYKQDSTFLNTKLNSKIHYQISEKSKLAVTFNTENSENLLKNQNRNTVAFKNYFIGLQFNFEKENKDYFNNKKIQLEINPSFGSRNTLNINNTQIKIETTASYLLEISNRSNIYIKNKTGHLNSDKYFDNELFRIGGANSIRGFNEQSIFSSSFSYFNLEYRYLTSNKSYFYSITDIGKFKYNDNTNDLLSFGLGYLFLNKNSKININTSFGKINNAKFDFKNTKLAIGWINYF
jgi:outer membrane protein assembly factor BamA